MMFYFRARADSLARVLHLVFFFFLTLSGFVTISGRAEVPHTNQIVVMISVDGLAGYYLDDPKAEMPTIRGLATAGARASSMKASVPTVTWPNHTTLVTGVTPAKHGVLGNNYWDRAAHRRVVLISDPELDKAQIVKVPTIYDLAKKAGLKTAAIKWPATRNASTLDWTIPDVSSADILRKYSTPALLAECRDAGLQVDDGKVPFGKGDQRGTGDERSTDIFCMILQRHHPDLALLHFLNVDHQEHLHGPRSKEAYAQIKRADSDIAKIMATLKKEYPGRATVFVVSDHGFSPIKEYILPNVVLRKAGLTGKDATAQVEFVSQAGSAFIYIDGAADKRPTMAQIKRAFSGLRGMQKIITSDQFDKMGVATPATDPHAPDMILFAREGWAFGDTASGDLPFEQKPERKGTHGHDPNIPDLHATFVAWGHGIKQGVRLGEITNLDVAPTIAQLLGVAIPNADGRCLPILNER
jgi:predicted AlkP superfamily pyrophosphatase or phosphodiesterase